MAKLIYCGNDKAVNGLLLKSDMCYDGELVTDVTGAIVFEIKNSEHSCRVEYQGVVSFMEEWEAPYGDQDRESEEKNGCVDKILRFLNGDTKFDAEFGHAVIEFRISIATFILSIMCLVLSISETSPNLTIATAILAITSVLHGAFAKIASTKVDVRSRGAKKMSHQDKMDKFVVYRQREGYSLSRGLAAAGLVLVSVGIFVVATVCAFTRCG